MSSLEQQVGALVRHHRKLADLTQGQLAELIDRQVATISRIENGDAAPSFETLSKLAEALKIEPRELFGIGAFAARAGRADPLEELVGLVAPLDEQSLDWISRVVRAALSNSRVQTE